MNKTDDEIADEAEKEMESALQVMEVTQLRIAEVYATTMLYTYNKWLDDKQGLSTKDNVERFLEEERST